MVLSTRRVTSWAWTLALLNDGQPDLPSGGHAELPGGGERDYLV